MNAYNLQRNTDIDSICIQRVSPQNPPENIALLAGELSSLFSMVRSARILDSTCDADFRMFRCLERP